MTRKRNPMSVKSRIPQFEVLDRRTLLAGDLAAVDDHMALAADEEVEPQFTIHHPPRIQPGNVPLVRTPAYTGLDQIEVIWQTAKVGEGDSDSFAVDYRRAGDVTWTPVPQNAPFAISVAGRLIHTATIPHLDWFTEYEYRVQHKRVDSVIGEYQHTFRTRLAAGDTRPFSFAAYGDSSRGTPDFQRVQSQINEHDPDFAVLLGDNIYTFGTHLESDFRFSASKNPPAVAWTAEKVDYFAIGNHDIFVESGQPSRDLYSMPIVEAGVNAHFALPTGEFDEHNFSFDYGDVHFVTIDTNPVDVIDHEIRTSRLESLIDWAVNDLSMSNAKWKVVYGHHPFIGTEKRMMPNDVYFQKAVTALNEADVDLFMLAHSHTFSWTYPLTGFADGNNDGIIGVEEVSFIPDSDNMFEKGAGLIQMVSGAGGGSLRCTAYAEPFFSQAYVRQIEGSGCPIRDDVGNLEYGFAKVEVNPRELTVSYISAETGHIVGDTNLNGSRDLNEPHFGQFAIVDSSVPDGDLTQDGLIDVSDIDHLFAAIRGEILNPLADLDQNGSIEPADVDVLLTNYLRTSYGDSNLDGIFNSQDLVLAFQGGGYARPEVNSTWTTGDWNGDEVFDSRDLVLAFQQATYQMTALPSDLGDDLGDDFAATIDATDREAKRQ